MKPNRLTVERPGRARTIAVFGSSRSAPESLEFNEARELGSLLAHCGFDVLTGGYTGVMEATSLGAKAVRATSVRAITLRAWGAPNEHVTDFVEAPDLFERQRLLVEGADAFVALHGGPGTLSEVSLVWALNQAGLMNPCRPLILVGPRWHAIAQSWSKLLHTTENDMKFLSVVTSVSEAAERLVQLFR